MPSADSHAARSPPDLVAIVMAAEAVAACERTAGRPSRSDASLRPVCRCAERAVAAAQRQAVDVSSFRKRTPNHDDR
jgi:hypothetical protein